MTCLAELIFRTGGFGCSSILSDTFLSLTLLLLVISIGFYFSSFFMVDSFSGCYIWLMFLTLLVLFLAIYLRVVLLEGALVFTLYFSLLLSSCCTFLLHFLSV